MVNPLQVDKTELSTWVFGYGSLVHTPNFAFNQKVVGYIKGYRRVFWQGSTDHRGTPQYPGRTVTLTEDGHPDATTWGVAYQIAGTPEEQAAALSYLEWREKQYDVRHRVDVYGQDGEVAVRGALVYIASPTNANYLGPVAISEIAAQIATSKGPSGHNYEYLFKLADAMRSMGVSDPDLYGLEDMVRCELTKPARQLGMAVDETSSTGALIVQSVTIVEEAECSHEFRLWHQRGVKQMHRETEECTLQAGVDGDLETADVHNPTLVCSLEAVCASAKSRSEEPG